MLSPLSYDYLRGLMISVLTNTKEVTKMNTNNSSTKDFKDIVLTDELKKIIKIASKFVAKNDFREQLKYVHIVNYNDKLAIISTNGHALFKYETDIDMLVSEYGFVSGAIILDKDFKTKLDNVKTFNDLEFSFDNFADAIQRYFADLDKNKEEANTSINLNSFYMETISKTCKELCSRRLPAFNLEVHQTYIICKLYVVSKGNCSIVLSKMNV